MAQPSDVDVELTWKAVDVELMWKYKEREIESMYVKLRDKVHARIYRTFRESKRLKTEAKWLKSVIEEKNRKEEEAKRLKTMSKWFKPIVQDTRFKAKPKCLKLILEEKRRIVGLKRLLAERDRLKREYNRLTWIIEGFESIYEPWREEAMRLLKRLEWIDESTDEVEDTSTERKQLASRLEQLGRKANKKLKELAKNIDSITSPNNLNKYRDREDEDGCNLQHEDGVARLLVDLEQ